MKTFNIFNCLLMVMVFACSAGNGTLDVTIDSDTSDDMRIDDVALEDGRIDISDDTPADLPPDSDPCADHCSNGVNDCGEEGIDCGGGCTLCGALVIRGNWIGIQGSDGMWHVALPTGQLVMEPNDVLDLMAGSGKNLIKIDAGAGGWYEGSLWIYRNNNFNDGLDPDSLDRIETFLADALEREIGVLIGLWGTVALECAPADPVEGPLRWDVNPWNGLYCCGGPYDEIDATERCGKRSFLTFPSYGDFVYNPGDSYPASADMYTRGQWRQEEIVYNLADIAKDYPNAAFFLMWEAYDNSTHQCGDCGSTSEQAENWHAHMSELIKSISPTTLVTTHIGRGPLFRGLDFSASSPGPDELDHFCDRGPNVTVGWGHPDVTYCCETACEYTLFFQHMRAGWVCSIQMGSPWWEYKPYTCYDDHVDPYTLDLRDYFDSIETWDDEPGDEITEATFPPWI